MLILTLKLILLVCLTLILTLKTNIVCLFVTDIDSDSDIVHDIVCLFETEIYSETGIVCLFDSDIDMVCLF